MTLQRMGLPSETDQLFGRLERGVFTDDSPASVIEERKGVYAIPGGTADDVYLTPSIITLLRGGAANGTFIAGPDDDSAVIDNVENVLPGWQIVHSINSSWKFERIVDSGAPDGYAIRVTALAGIAAGDESFLETYIPVGPHQQYMAPTVWQGAHSGADARPLMRCQFFQSDLTTTVDAATVAVALLNPLRTWVVPSGLATYLRVRIGAKANPGTPTAGDYITMRACTAEPIPLHMASISGTRTAALSGTGDNPIYYPATSTGATSAWYVAPRGGLVLAVSGMVQSSRTAGTLTLGVRNATPGLDLTLARAVINAANPDQRYAVGTLHGWTQLPVGSGDDVAQFDAGDKLRLNAATSGFTPTANEVVASAELAMWDSTFDVVTI